MVGIKEAMERVGSHRNEGRCVATGTIRDCVCTSDEKCSTCSNIPYMIVRLNGHGKCRGGLITVYDYGYDVRINENIKVLDDVILVLQDNWSAKWSRLSDVSRPKISELYRCKLVK